LCRVRSLIPDGVQKRFFEPFFLLRRLHLVFVQPLADFDVDLSPRDRPGDDVGKLALIFRLLPVGKTFTGKLRLDTEKCREKRPGVPASCPLRTS